MSCFKLLSLVDCEVLLISPVVLTSGTLVVIDSCVVSRKSFIDVFEWSVVTTLKTSSDVVEMFAGCSGAICRSQQNKNKHR